MALTWRNVDAPDFRGSMEGYRLFSNMLNTAFSTASQGLADFQQVQTDAVDRQALARSLQFSDPKAYQAALANGQITGGADPAQLSADALAVLGSRTSDLISNAYNSQRLEANQYDFQRTKDNNQALDAARPALTALATAAASGDPKAVAVARQQYAPQLAGLPADKLLAFYSDVQGLEGGQLDNQADRLRNTIAQRTDNEEQQAIGVATEVLRNAGNANDARGFLEGMTLPAGVRARVNDLLGKNFGPLYAPIGSGAAATPGGPAGTKAGSPYDVTVGFQPTGIPVSSMTLGQAVNFGKDTLIPSTRGRADLGLSPTLGSSAMGAYQITASTLEDVAPKVLGKDWQQQGMTPENQEKIAQYLFDQRKDGNLKDTWASLPDARPGAYKDVPWSQMRNLITQGEIGSILPSLEAATQQARTAVADVNNRVMQNVSQQGAATDLLANMSNTATVGEVASELIKTTFPGGDVGEVVTLLNDVRQRGKVNPKQAGAILARNIEEARFFDFLPGTTANISDDLRVNDAGVNAAIEQAAGGQTFDQALANQETQAVGQMIARTQQTYQAAAQQLAEVLERSKSQPQLVRLVPQYRAQLQLAQAALQAALDRQQTDPTLMSQRTGVEPGVVQLEGQRGRNMVSARYGIPEELLK